MDRYRAKYTLFKRKGNKTYYFYYRDADGNRIARSTGKTVEAQAKAEAEKFLGDQKPTKRSPTLEKFATNFFDWERSDWIRRQHAKGRPFSKAVAQFRHIHLDRHILPEFGKRRLDEINRVEVERWLIGLDLSNQTKNHILYTLRIILRDAVAAGKLEASSCEIWGIFPCQLI
jgi:hypothetical protein